MGGVINPFKNYTIQAQPKVIIKQGEANFMTQNHTEHSPLDPINSLHSSSSPTIACEQFGPTTSQSELAITTIKQNSCRPAQIPSGQSESNPNFLQLF